MSTSKLWRFTPLDTLFFRDGRPFNAGETVWLNSQFPPSGRTLQGAIRSAIVEHSDMDWPGYHAACKPENGANNPLKAIGNAQDLGEMRLSGPFLLCDREWLLPAPLDLAYSKAEKRYSLLGPSAKPVECDLGAVRLPQASAKGLKTQEGKYVTGAVMAGLLAGQTGNLPSKPGVLLWTLFADDPGDPKEKALTDLEPKVGLGRDNALRRHKEGMLYSIKTVRLREGVTLAMVVAGIDEKLHPSGPFIQRLGGEGKLAKVSISDPPTCPRMPTLIPKAGKLRFKLVLTTPTYFKECWRPDGFALRENVGWQGSWPAITANQEDIELASVTLVSACIGKAYSDRRLELGGQCAAPPGGIRSGGFSLFL